MAKRVFVLALFCCLSSALSGCGGSGGGGLLGGGGCSPTSYSMTFPSDAGYSATGNIFAASGCFQSATVNTYTSLTPIMGAAFVPTGNTPQVLLYLGFTFSSTEYATGIPSLTVTLPAGTVTANRQFYVAYNDESGSQFGWIPAIAGPATASGSTVSFGTGNGNTTFDANQEAELAIYSLGP